VDSNPRNLYMPRRSSNYLDELDRRKSSVSNNDSEFDTQLARSLGNFSFERHPNKQGHRQHNDNPRLTRDITPSYFDLDPNSNDGLHEYKAAAPNYESEDDEDCSIYDDSLSRREEKQRNADDELRRRSSKIAEHNVEGNANIARADLFHRISDRRNSFEYGDYKNCFHEMLMSPEEEKKPGFSSKD